MTKKEKQLIISSYTGDSYWMRQKRVLRIKFGGYVKNYLEYKHSLITTIQKSNLWGSVNRKNILYEFTLGKSDTLNKLKESSFWEVERALGPIDQLGFALLIFDNGSFHKTLNYYNLYIGKEYSKRFATQFENLLNTKFGLHSTYHKQKGAKGYFLQFKVYDTPTIANILNKFNNHDYKYKIPSSETIAKYASRYKDIPKDLRGRRAYDIVRSLEKSKEN